MIFNPFIVIDGQGYDGNHTMCVRIVFEQYFVLLQIISSTQNNTYEKMIFEQQ